MAIDIDLLRSLLSLQDLAESGTKNVDRNTRFQAGVYTAPYQQQLVGKQAELADWEAVQENKTPVDAYANPSGVAAYNDYSNRLGTWVNNLTQADGYQSYRGPAWYAATKTNANGEVTDADAYGYSANSNGKYYADHVVATAFPDAAKSFGLSELAANNTNPGNMQRPDYGLIGTVVTDAAPVVPTLEGTFSAAAPSEVGKALDKGIRSQQENLRAIALGEGDMSDLKYAKRNIGTARDIKDEVLAYGSDRANQVTEEVNAYKNAMANYSDQVAALGNRNFTEQTSEKSDSPLRAYHNSQNNAQSYLQSGLNVMAASPISYVNKLKNAPGNADDPNSGGGEYNTAGQVANLLHSANLAKPAANQSTVSTYNPYQTLKNNLGQIGNFINLPSMPTSLNISDAPEYKSQIDTRWLEKQRRKKKVEALTRRD